MKYERIYDNEVSSLYFSLAEQDAKAANALEKNRLYNQAGYFYLQAMEKYIKGHIATKINVTLPYFAEQLRKTIGHSLEESVFLLLEVYCGNNEPLRIQMDQQIWENVLHLGRSLQNTSFQRLHNNLRYPFYSQKYKNYTVTVFDMNDCSSLRTMFDSLKTYLDKLGQIR